MIPFERIRSVYEFATQFHKDLDEETFVKPILAEHLKGGITFAHAEFDGPIVLGYIVAYIDSNSLNKNLIANAVDLRVVHKGNHASIVHRLLRAFEDWWIQLPNVNEGRVIAYDTTTLLVLEDNEYERIGTLHKRELDRGLSGIDPLREEEHSLPA